MLKHIILGFCWLAGALSFGASANNLLPVSAEIRDNITRHFSKSLPSLSIDRLELSPIPNLYQVTSGPVVMYVSPDGHYAISGDILDLRDGKTNLTEKTRQKALAYALDKLGEANMIIFSPPLSVRHRYTITVFTDLECAYCQKLHAHIDKITQLGIKVRYVAFPRTGRDTPSYESLTSVWCAGDRKAAFTEAMLGKTRPLKCQGHYVDKQFHLGALAGVIGTPTFVIEGKLVPGYLEPTALLTLIENITAQARLSS